MQWFAYGVTLLAALGIMGIGLMYLVRPRLMTPNFGLPQPAPDPATGWWLRLKGGRDIVSGLVVLALMKWGTPPLLGIVLLIEALVPASDMSLVLASRGRIAIALGVHGVTAGLMAAAAVALIIGAA